MANRFRINKLSNVDQFVMSYGGLRGAVAFALVLLIDKTHIPLAPLFVTTTICVIYFTVFLQGITIKPLVKILNVKRAEKRKPTMNEVTFCFQLQKSFISLTRNSTANPRTIHRSHDGGPRRYCRQDWQLQCSRQVQAIRQPLHSSILDKRPSGESNPFIVSSEAR